MTIKLLAIDMDSTFLRDDKTFDLETFKPAALKLLDQGVVICIASGNIEHRLVSYFDEEMKSKLYFAADNGNFMFRNDEMIHTFGLEREEIEQILAYLEDKEGYYLAMSTGGTAYVLGEDMTEKVREKFKIYFDEVVKLDSFLDIPEDEKVTKVAMWTEFSLEKNKEITQQFNQMFGEGSSVTSGGGWLDIYNNQGSKGAALHYLQEKYGIKAEETMAFGDSLNDAPMMKYAHYSVAMSNADPDLKSLCRYEIGSNNEQAVQACLQKLATTGNPGFMEEYRRD